jgi:amino-acid N-acetyltransferase
LTIELVPAEQACLSDARELLVRAGLPTEGLEEQFPGAFVFARVSTEAVGMAGLERYGDVGLLRSVVVVERHRGSGLGRQLTRHRLDAAAQAGIRRVFLLTTTAPTYFEKLGFVTTPRAQVPPALAASTEFARACPDSAVCLAYEV